MTLGFPLFADKKHHIIIGILAAVAFFSTITLIILVVVLRRSRANVTAKNDPNIVSKRSVGFRTISIKNRDFHAEHGEGNLKINFWK